MPVNKSALRIVAKLACDEALLAHFGHDAREAPRVCKTRNLSFSPNHDTPLSH
jgi:hypothetical protein